MDLSQAVLPLDQASSEGHLAVALHLKLIAALHSIGKLDDDELTTVAAAIIAEMQGDKERFDAWALLEGLVPDYERPEATRRAG